MRIFEDMNIAIFTMSLNKGGAERVITNLCNQCLVEKHNITIITCIKAVSQYPLDGRIRHVCIDHASEEMNQGKVSRFMRRRRMLARMLETMSIDIMLSILPEPSFLALSLKKRFQFPMVVSVRSDPAMEYDFPPYRLMMQMLYPKADGLIMQTEEAKAYFPEEIQKKSVVIPNPINMDAVREPFFGRRKKEIVAVGRLIEEKNYPMLLRAYKRLERQFPDYKLMIYGEGSLRNKLEIDIRSLGLEGRVVLAGQKDDIFDRIQGSSLFVMASNHEGMPNALMEAMALGLPVIATDCPCGGPRFLIENQVNGILVAPDDEETLAEAAVQILSNREYAERLGKEARKIKERLAPEKVYRQWEDYLLYIKGASCIIQV